MKAKAAAIGTSELLNKSDQLLDDPILGIHKHKKAVKGENEEQIDAEMALIAAGKSIRKMIRAGRRKTVQRGTRNVGIRHRRQESVFCVILGML